MTSPTLENFVICPNCGEDNSDNFRFCGMCGTLLDARRPVAVQRVAAAPEATYKNTSVAAEPPRSRGNDAPAAPAVAPAPFIAGPSLLGLDNSPAKPHNLNAPTLDTLREKSFSGLDSFFEPEEPKTGSRRVLLLLGLLVALGLAGWWTYSNYLGATGLRGLRSATSNTTSTPPPSNSPATLNPASSPAQTSPETTQPAASASAPAPTPPAPTPNPVVKAAEVEASQPHSVASKAVAPAKPSPPQKVEHTDASPQPRAAEPAPALPDNGDAEFKKGEAYLYGRGVPENCSEAIKYLKDASAKRNTKARSTFGTMYATGHCVPRDFPTSYSWFAQALRVDPNNQILEKDLTAVWNQMTPPERQMATKLSQ